jgi:MoxR-like ATPase
MTQESQVREEEIDGMAVRLAASSTVSDRSLVGREDLLKKCRLMWGLDEHWKKKPSLESLPFRLVGEPGVGKNVIVNELVKRIQASNSPSPPYYVIQCNEEMTPEDLAMSWGPAAGAPGNNDNGATRMILKASGLTTAIREGGIVFLDEINRAPPRCLSMLVPVLDDRNEIFSAMTNTWVKAKPERPFPFLFCCAMNPNAGDTTYPLPKNIKQRTLPIIDVPPLPLADVMQVIEARFAGIDRVLIQREFQDAINAGVSLRILLRTLDSWTREGGDAAALSKLLAGTRKDSDER